MKATFTLAPADFKRLMNLVVKKSRRNAPYRMLWFVGRIFVWLPIGAGVSAFSKVYQRADEMQQGLLFVASMFATGLIFSLIYSAAWRRMYISRAICPNGAFLTTQTVEANEDGLSLENSLGKSFTKWTGFLGLEEDKINLYLFIDSLQAVVLPKSIPCIDELTRLAKEKINAKL
jgi:hypothetical protein